MDFYTATAERLQAMQAQSLYKTERVLTSSQSTKIKTDREVINMCANNYLGFANHPQLIATAQQALADYGYGMASVRFICGTQDIHLALEKKLATFLGKQDAILYSSCFDANTGLFETLLDANDAIISDTLNHASIIDGVRLCKAQRFRYRHNDMQDLQEKLQASSKARYRLIVTDGVFSMDGTFAQVERICALAKKHKALVMVDDSHAVGVVGKRGAGTCEEMDVDIITGTLGKALGGAMGGYAAGRKVLIDLLRQQSRPYLFSNSLAPVVVATSLRALQLLEEEPSLRAELFRKTMFMRTGLKELGFTVLAGTHPIIPIMVKQADIAQQMAVSLYDEGVYAVGFFYPVVPANTARIRLQISAAHADADLQRALQAFAKVGKKLKVIV